jgi:hypothetical protein
MKSKYYIFIIFILAIILFYNQSCIKQKHNFIKETMTNISPVDELSIINTIKNIYDIDVLAIKNLSDTSMKIQTTSLTIMGNIDITNKLKVSGNFILSGNTNLIPKGIIIGWASAVAPDGWAICNGENGTPDLRGKFILGSDTKNQINSLGGSDKITLTLQNLPDHWHNLKNDQGFKFLDQNAKIYTMKDGEGGGKQFTLYTNGGYGPSNIDILMGSSIAKTLLNSDNTVVRNPTDIVEPISIMPQYYVLTYIIKL